MQSRQLPRSRSAVPGWFRNMLIIVGTSTHTVIWWLLDQAPDEVGSKPGQITCVPPTSVRA